MRRVVTVLALALVAGALVAGCGQGSAGGQGPHEPITLGYIEWDENVAVSNLTKVLLEEELNYEEVELQLADVGPIFQGVANGDLAAFQDVWMPNHTNYLSEVEDEVKLLEPWYEGQTSYGIAVPSYMDVQSLADLSQLQGVNQIHGIEPGAAFHPTIRDQVFPAYGLENWELIESSTPAMLSGLERAVQDQEPYVFLRWEPHWMNAKYDLRYLEDPKDAQGKFNDPAKIRTLVGNNLQQEDPMTYAFLNAISMSAEELNSLELAIQEAGDPQQGVQAWLENNQDVVQPWIDAAQEAQQS